MSFPKDFIWGAASAAAQIEGGYLEDGRTPSVWDNMPAGKIKRNENCHIACDHYHHWKEDIALMKKIGLRAYRFSISWSRVIPSKGCVNPKGIAFYSELVDELLKAGIQPMVTLFHSDMPQWVFDQGGWLSDKTVEDFAFFAGTMAMILSDRVQYWFTINEPQCIISDSLDLAGKKENKKAADASYRCMLLCHGRAVQELREHAKQPLKIGMVIMGLAMEPVPGVIEEEDAYEAMFADMAGFMGMSRWLDPVIEGIIPESMQGVLSQDDIAVIYQKMDLFCCNVYGSANFYEIPEMHNPLCYPGNPKSQIGMPIRPECLYYMARFAYQKYGLPILFTENGFSNNDFIMMDGKVHDPQRIDYIHSYLLALHKAIKEGIPVEGYLYWSVLDNFEWFEGYDMRFGLIYVDYQSQKRVLKDSALYYRSVIATNGEKLLEEKKYE